MEITILGYFSILLTVIFLFTGKKIAFLYASVFFSGYSGASVINILGNAVQPSLYFFAIYCLLLVFSTDMFKMRLDNILIVFFCYCLLSLINALLFKNVIIMNQEGVYSSNSFSLSNLIHVTYLFIDLLFLNELLHYMGSAQVKEKLIKIYKLGLFSVILICLYQLLAFKLDLPFDLLFRQNPNGNVQGSRLYGPCIEASMLCYYLLPSVVFVFINRQSLFDWVLIVSSLLMGFLTLSSTFLVGALISIFFAALYFIFNFNKVKFKLKFHHIVCFIAVILLCIIFNEFILKLFKSLLDKLNRKNTSGIERFDSFFTMFKVGLYYPFGVGFGSGRSKDLLSTWMCNIGIIGVLMFIGYILHYLKTAYKSKSLITTIPFILVLCLMMISVSEPYNLFVWYLVFFGTSVTSKRKRIGILLRKKGTLLKSEY